MMKKTLFAFIVLILTGSTIIYCNESTIEIAEQVAQEPEEESDFEDLSPEIKRRIIEDNPQIYDDPSQAKVFFQRILSWIANQPYVLDAYVAVLRLIYRDEEPTEEFVDSTPEQIDHIVNEHTKNDDL